MSALASKSKQTELIALAMVKELGSLGDISSRPLFDGIGVYESHSLFGFIDVEGTFFLRASEATAPRFKALGSVKHPEMPYWSVPWFVIDDASVFADVAYQAIDVAHLAHGPVVESPLVTFELPRLFSSGVFCGWSARVLLPPFVPRSA